MNENTARANAPAAPDLIHINVSNEREVEADHAYLYVTVRGSSLFTGNAALTKAREVSQLVAELIRVGIVEGDIHLQSVYAETSSVGFGKSSAAVYSLRFLCPRLSILGDVIGAITGQKNASLTSIEWGYSDKETYDQWIEMLLMTANGRAKRIADTFGTRLLGVHSFRDTLQDPEKGLRQPMAQPDFAMARARVTTEDFGMALSHSKIVTLTVEVAYRVSGFVEDGG